MKYFSLELFQGHPIIEDQGDIILIDTGSPSSISTGDEINFLNNTYSVKSNFMGLTIENISEMLGKQITALMGADILKNYKVLVDYKEHKIGFSPTEIDFNGSEAQFSSFMNIPVIDLSVNGKPIKFFLDTGARLSYLPQEETTNMRSKGKEEDFYPTLGKFTSETFDIITQIGGHKFNATYGNLPPLLQMTLGMGGAQGIIGYDFFNNFEVVLDLEDQKLIYKPYSNRTEDE